MAGNHQNTSDWIQHVPSGWTLGRLKNSVSSVVNGVWGEDPSDDTDGVICVRVADFDRVKFSVRLDNPTFRAISATDFAKRRLSYGDLLIEKSGGSGDLNPVGFVVRYEHDVPAVCSNFVARVKTSQIADSNFFKYVHAAAYAAGVNKRAIKQTTGIQNLDMEAYLNELAPYPPLEEQQAIASFLDRETAKLDQLIEKKRRLIELLQEYRQAIITQAVTKGLDPNVPMKDSGIPWIGEVPVHWAVMKMTHIFGGIGSGTTPDSNEPEYYDGDIPWVITGDLNDDELWETSKHVTASALAKYTSLKLYPPGTLLVAMYGATIGKLAILRISATTNQACCALYNPRNVDTKFVFYWFMAHRRHIVSFGVGGGQPNISQEIIRNLRVAVPPLEEQKRILEYIESSTTNIGKAIRKLESQIELILEYRQALISSAVTGQIDVGSGPRVKWRWPCRE